MCPPITLLYEACEALGDGGGVKGLKQKFFVGMRQMKLPWTAQGLPAWFRDGSSLTYQGRLTLYVAGRPQQPGSFGMTFRQTRRYGPAALSQVSVSSQLGSAQGPVAVGTGSPQPAVLPAAALRTLRTGQTLDRDPVTGIVISVVATNGRTVTIRQANKAQTTYLVYDTGNGVVKELRTIQHPSNSIAQKDFGLKLTAVR